MGMEVEETQDGVLCHFHLSDNTPTETSEIELADGSKAEVIWKDILVEGEYPMSPGPGGATSQPMRVIASGESNYSTRTISMSDLEAAHDDGAFKYVTIPTRHEDQLLDNTGYVPKPKGLRRVEKKGKQVLQAALGFTEPDIKGKVERGTIPDVSAGIFFNWLNKHTKKKYRAAMKHVALTGVPFMGNLDPFKPVFASDDEIDVEKIEFFEFADDTSVDNSGSGDDSTGQSAEIIWDEKLGLSWLRTEVETALTPDRQQPDDGRPYVPQPSYYVQDVKVDGTNGQALAEEYFKGDRKRYVIPFTVSGDGVSLSPSTRWVEAREAMIAASDNIEERAVDVLREELGSALAEFGDNLSVGRMTLDHRIVIKNEQGSEWIADFALFSDGSVKVAPPEQWERTKAPNKPKEQKQRQAPPTVTLSDKIDTSTPRGRLEAARRRRAQQRGGKSTTMTK